MLALATHQRNFRKNQRTNDRPVRMPLTFLASAKTLATGRGFMWRESDRYGFDLEPSGRERPTNETPGIAT